MPLLRRISFVVCAWSLLSIQPVRAEVLKWVLIGDTGANCSYIKKSSSRESWLEKMKDSQQTKVAEHLAEVMSQETIRDIFFLGDNFYPSGLKAGALGDACLELAFTVPYGKLLPPEHLHLVPGNHDHYTKGSVSRQNDLSGKQWTFYTQPKLLQLEPGLVDVVLFDSMVMIQNRKARNRAQRQLTQQLKESKAPWVILMSHHPMHTIGEHSYRTFLGLFNKNDFVSIEYRLYTSAIRKAIVDSGKSVQIFAAGHDHSLQFLEEKEASPLLPTYHVVSGAGSKTSMVHSLGEKRWGDAVPGFAVLELDTDKPDRMVIRFLGSAKKEELKRFELTLTPQASAPSK